MHKKELIKGQQVTNRLKGLEKIHPHKLLTFLFLFGLSLIYSYLLISLTVETFLGKINPGTMHFPKFQIIAAFLILISMFIPAGLRQAFQDENLYLIRKRIFGLFLAGAVFIVFQGIGWLEFMFQGFNMDPGVTETYLYIITGFHMVSVLIGLGSLAYYLYLTRNIYLDGVARLIFFTSPYERTKLEIIQAYWAYLCFSWIFIVTWLIFLI